MYFRGDLPPTLNGNSINGKTQAYRLRTGYVHTIIIINTLAAAHDVVDMSSFFLGCLELLYALSTGTGVPVGNLIVSQL